MKTSQCDYCMNLTYDQESDEYYCSWNMDQDELEKVSYVKEYSCPYFRMGDDYTIVRKQGG